MKSHYLVILFSILLFPLLSSCVKDSNANELEQLRAENAQLSTSIADIQSSVYKIKQTAKAKIDSANTVITSKNTQIAVLNTQVTSLQQQVNNNSVAVDAMLKDINDWTLKMHDTLKTYWIKK